ncbi:Protein F44E2.4, partial [Aphelenchoides avenae]
MGHVNSTESKGRPKRPQRQESGDPFAELATKKPAVNNGRSQNGCSEDGTRRVAECVQDLESWLSELSSTNFSQTSIFKDDAMYASVQRGCQLVNQYSACVDGLPATCAPDDGPAKDWLASQTYTCELLVPSLREHLNCFSTARDAQCGAYSEPQKASAVCSLMASVL